MITPCFHMFMHLGMHKVVRFLESNSIAMVAQTGFWKVKQVACGRLQGILETLPNFRTQVQSVTLFLQDMMLKGCEKQVLSLTNVRLHVTQVQTTVKLKY